MNPEILELIQTEIDGQNSPSESSRLAQLCMANPAIQRELDAARAIGRALDTLSDARLPDGFTARVMDALPDEPAWARHRAPSRQPVRSSVGIFSRPWLNLAYGMVVGVFVTFAAMSTLDSGQDPVIGIEGTMAAAGADAVVKEHIDLGPGVSVSVSTLVEEEAVSVRIEGAIPPGIAPSIVFEQPSGESVIVPIIQP
jgi:anti-sigma factor RsiW